MSLELLSAAALLSVWPVVGHILLVILKVIGWILLVVLILLAILLLCPLTYRVHGRMFAPGNRKYDPDGTYDGYEAGDERLIAGKVVGAKVKATYLFSLLRVHADFTDKKLSWFVKLAWKKLAGSEEEEPADAGLEPPETQPAEPTKPTKPVEPVEPIETALESAAEPAEPVEPAEPIEPVEPIETALEPSAEPVEPAEPTAKSIEPAGPTEPVETPETAPGPEAAEEAKRPKQDIGRIVDKFFDFIDDLIDGADRVTDKLERKWDSLQDLLDRIDAFDDREKALEAVMRMLRRIIRQILPKNYRLEIDWGTGDPATTAKIAGYLEALDPLLRPKISPKKTLISHPDLEQKNIEFSLEAKNFFLLGGLLAPVVAALLNPHVWHLIKFVKNSKKQRT